ncbi:hypothetical protein ENTCAN_06779 [Enterobacter cancerogenus ATCC 35316]|nr:hypothetical protein ENTCAN_06779 [Enterobacter cancerogenus ATCC 35316]
MERHNNLLSILLVCGFRCFLSSIGAFGFIFWVLKNLLIC